MRAAVFHGNGELRVQDWPKPAIERSDDVLIRVEACGVCGSDLQVMAVPPGHPSTPPVVLGHEFIGRVVEAGPAAADLRVGMRVAVDPDPKCGACSYCRAGRPENCLNVVALGVYADGALAEYVKAPAASVFPLADSVPRETAALIEPLACVVNAVNNRATPRPGESAVVFGAGTIGCLFVALLRAAGAGPVVVVEPSEARWAVARAVGASETLGPGEFAERRAELLPLGADIIVDAVGSQFATAVDHAAMGGRIVLFGQNANVVAPVKQYTITERSLTILGTYITHYTFPTAIRLVESGVLPLAPIVSHVLPLERTLDGLDLLRSGVATKVVLTP
jgi:2-desacetyl-2-hydroxyethyl bacteriochlorophyllide A dehydrogenase